MCVTHHPMAIHSCDRYGITMLKGKKAVAQTKPQQQEAHGPHRSPENQFKSINTFAQSYDYIVTLIWRRKKDDHLFDN